VFAGGNAPANTPNPEFVKTVRAIGGCYPFVGRIGQAGGLFDIIFEKLGIKKKSRKRSDFKE